MDHYLRTRQPVPIFTSKTDNGSKKIIESQNNDSKPIPNQIFIAPLNTKLTGWNKLAKRC